jgi:iron-sulfur cluster assembly protein
MSKLDVQNTLKFTQPAAEYMHGILESNPNKVGIRFRVKSSGCSGNSYVLDLASSQEQDDYIFESYGIKIFIDPVSFNLVKGTTIDLSQTGLNQQIKFINPNVVGECGCGISFSTNK